jgi:hypothetical protein
MTDRDRVEPNLLRAEAERLVAAGLAAVSVAADRIGAPTRERGGAAAAGFDALGDMLFGPSGHRRHSVANDSPECCKCPVCRMIAAARKPNPVVAERLATGAGLLAESAVRMLRLVASAGSAAAGAAGVRAPRPDAAGAGAAGGSSAAGAAGSGAAGGSSADRERDPWAAATAE